MKGTVETVAASLPVLERSWPGMLSELFKARLTALVLVTTFVGFFVGTEGAIPLVLLAHAMVGTALLASGASALNQWMEKDHDALMKRTEGRPLPSGQMQPETAFWIGTACALAGLGQLAWAVNGITAILGAVTVFIYLFIYTPLKRITPLNTIVGAVPGALPPLMGWTAARGEVSLGGWALFAILFFWQLPHFMAIAWMYREEYAKAGYVMLPAVDPDGQRTGWQTVSYTLGLLPVSLSPFTLHLTGKIYLAGALAMGLMFLFFAVRFARELQRDEARRLFYASIIYLPLLLGLMVLDRIR